MSVIIFYNCQIDAIKIKGIREAVKKRISKNENGFTGPW